MRFSLIIVFLISLNNLLAQQKLSTEQEAWLFRIVTKTPVLNQNWQNYFEFDTKPFVRESMIRSWVDYDAIYKYQLYNPQSLTIFYDSIQSSSNGLISEAAIKLTLWELNEELKKYLYQGPGFNDSLIQIIQKPLSHLLPARLSNKRRTLALNTIMHPSLPIFKKIEQLDKAKIEPELQKQLLNQWSKIISDYSFERSQYFFKILSHGEELKTTCFLAAGEGSGTAGLLYEMEPHPDDSTKTWYAKGIGLFTYKTRVHKDKLLLQPHLKKTLSVVDSSSIALHTSLWGLDSSFKPMLIITDDTVSYHLFAHSVTNGLSPNRTLSKGISHLERIEEHRQRNIIEALDKVNDNGLLKKAYESRSEVENEISKLESEIDTLRKYEPDNEEAISYRKRLIDAKLTTLSKKEQRVKELERSFAAKYKEVDQARKKLDDMIELLGPQPQQCHKEGAFYQFPSGVKFDTITQDLIFPSGIEKRELQIRLLSAGYTLEGSKKDEVQAYVSLTNAKERRVQLTKTKRIAIDTSFVLYFHPDEYISYQKPLLDQFHIEQMKQFKSFHFSLGIADKPDSIKSSSQSYSDRSREYKQPRTVDAQNRFTQIHLQSSGDTLTIQVLASTDPVATRLSKVDGNLKKALKILNSSPNNNQYLMALRAAQTLQDLLKMLDLKIPAHNSKSLNNNLNIDNDEFKLILQSISIEL
jgi:uncharacterized coiled-coil protein SlyX